MTTAISLDLAVGVRTAEAVTLDLEAPRSLGEVRAGSWEPIIATRAWLRPGRLVVIAARSPGEEWFGAPIDPRAVGPDASPAGPEGGGAPRLGDLVLPRGLDGRAVLVLIPRGPDRFSLIRPAAPRSGAAPARSR